ncbi:MAG TPA: hypothetical protein VKZ53_04610 [Candidatus Angelobacter sp.]|nr:hypothetical protein [Candidatus Angelobacter sp.]
MKNKRQSLEFNATMLMAIVVTGVLSLALLSMIYGCLRAGQHTQEIHNTAAISEPVLRSL